MTRVNELALLLLVRWRPKASPPSSATILQLAAERLNRTAPQRVFDHLLARRSRSFDSRTSASSRRACGTRDRGRPRHRRAVRRAVRFALIGVIVRSCSLHSRSSPCPRAAVAAIALTAWFLGGRVKTRSTQNAAGVRGGRHRGEESLGGIRTVRAFAQERRAGSLCQRLMPP